MANTSLLIKSSLALLIAGGVYGWWHHSHATSPATDASIAATADADAGKGHDGGKSSGGHKRGDRPTPVTAVTVKQVDVPVIYNALGTATPSAVVSVTSRVNGQLTQVLFQEGQLVKQGQLLAQLDARPFETALGQILGQAARNQALLKNSQIDLDRFKTLQAQDSIASQQVDSQASLVQQYQGTVQADHAAIENARLQLSFTNITAPISGRIGLRQVDAGNNITNTNIIAVINAVRPIHVVFTLPEDSINRLVKTLQDNREARKLTVEAWDKANTQLLAKGKLASLDNQIDTTTGTIKLKAVFENADDSLFPNQFVNVKLHGETLHNASVVPVNAIQHGPQGDFVYLLRKGEHGDVVHVQAVRTGYSDGTLAAVMQGLRGGDRIVGSGVDKLKEGAKVQVRDAADTGDNRHQHPGHRPAGQ